VLIIPSRLIATCFALVCFAGAVIVGVAAGNSAMTILWRALLVMVGAWLVGQAVGAVMQHTLDQQLETYRRQNPLPGEAVASVGETEESESETEPSQQSGESAAKTS